MCLFFLFVCLQYIYMHLFLYVCVYFFVSFPCIKYLCCFVPRRSSMNQLSEIQVEKPAATTDLD